MQKQNILLIEDSDEMRATVRMLLESVGYSVSEARNGREGLAMAQALDPSELALIVLDIFMPQMGGQEFLEIKEKTPAIAGVPVVVCSTAIGGAEGGSKDVVGRLTKPFKFSELLDLVQQKAAS